jgi:hypothetical protein
MQALHVNLNPDENLPSHYFLNRPGGLLVGDESAVGVDVVRKGMKNLKPSVTLYATVEGGHLAVASEWTCDSFLALCGLRVHVGKLVEKDAGVVQLDAVDLISDERTMQRLRGYDEAHDREKHGDGSMLDFAEMLLVASSFEPAQPPELDKNDWVSKATIHACKKHGHNKVKLLQIAGALIAAEIDRLRGPIGSPVKR